MPSEVHGRQQIERGAGRQERRHNALIRVLLRGRRQCARAGRVARVRLGAERKQELHDARPVLRDRMMQRRAAVLVARHPGRKQCGISRDHGAHIVHAIERDGAPEIELRAVIEQVFGDVLPDLAKARGPTEHAKREVVALAVDVRAGLDQQLDCLEVAVHRCEVQRRGVVGKVAAVEIGTALDQQANGAVLIAQHRKVQRGGLLKVVAAKRIDQRGMSVETRAQRGDVAGLRRPHDTADRFGLIRRTRGARHGIAHE